jgi:hypothetical protein
VKHTREFDSLAAFAAYVSNRERATGGDSSHSDHGIYGRHSWAFGMGFRAAVETAMHGWPEGAAKARKLLDSIPDLAPQESYASATYYDVQGSYVDVGEYSRGVPECMVDFREDKRTARFARIVVSGFYSAAIKAETVMARGVTIAAIVDALETRGIRCSVVHVVRGRVDWETRVTLKHETEPLNLDVLAFALAHPATFRRLHFGAQELEPTDVQRENGLADFGSYLYPHPIPEEPDTLTFQPVSSDGGWTPENARTRIVAALERFAK